MAVIIIFSSLIGFASGLVSMAILGGGVWSAVQTYLIVSFGLSLLLGGALAFTRPQTRTDHATEEDLYAHWDTWHAEEDLRTGRMIAKMAKSRTALNQTA